MNKYQAFRYISVLLLIVVSQAVYSDARIERLEEQLEEQLKLNRIPGFAVVVVEDGVPIFARGFGLKSIEEVLPVTHNTIFPINSLSKPITSIIAGIRVDEGIIDWDDNLANYLPNYKFLQSNETIPITLRDALSHRTGYGRNDTLWSNPKIARQDIIEFAPLAKPLATFREEFHYNNVMYLAAGMATAHDEKLDWDKILKNKLLVPLGMESTTTDSALVESSGRLADGYFFSDIEQRHIEVAHADRSNIAPATGIYSSISDMGKLLTLLLNERNDRGESLIKQKTLAEIFKPTTVVSPVFSYGLGWYISEYNGEKLLDHSGNGEGFSSTIALLPESNIGFVLLTNVSITPLQTSSINLIFDALTKENLNEESEKLDIDYSPFVGQYIANFWQFQNAHFVFKVVGGKPALNIPGQALYMLKPPDAEGKFYFEITNKVAVSFNLDDQNNVISMIHYEAGEEFVLPKKVSSIEAEKAALLLSQKTADALYKKMNLNQQKNNFEKLGTLQMRGTLLQEQSGVSGHFTLLMTKLDWHLNQDLGIFGSLETKSTTDGGFNKRLRHSYVLKSYLNQQARREHPLNFLYWDELYETVFLNDAPDTEDNIVVTLDSADLSSVTAKLKESSAQIEQISMLFIDPIWGTYPRTFSYKEYHPYCGVDIPMIFEIDDHEIGNTIFKVLELTSDNCDDNILAH